MSTKRKDTFMAIAVTLWLISNVTTFILFGNDGTLLSNLCFIAMFTFVILCKPLMRWLNEK